MTRSRRTRVLGAVLLLATAGCTGVSGAQEAPTDESPADATTTTSTTTPPTTRAVLPPLADQTAPRSTLGMHFQDGGPNGQDLLWIADFHAGQIVAADPDSGAIMRRLTSDETVSDEVTTVAVTDSGVVYWTGLNDGSVGAMQGTRGSTVGSVPPGTCSIALSPDGKTLYAGGAVAASTRIWQMDLATERAEVRPTAAVSRLRSFTVGPDGFIYGPRFGPAADAATAATPAGALVKVDPNTGAELLLAAVDSPIAVELSADGATAYVLSMAPGRPPALSSVAVATGVVTPLPAPRTPLADSLAVAPDGRIFVSAYNEPVISIVSPSGNVTTRTIGIRPRPTPDR